jgi:hypothetical protein
MVTTSYSYTSTASYAFIVYMGTSAFTYRIIWQSVVITSIVIISNTIVSGCIVLLPYQQVPNCSRETCKCTHKKRVTISRETASAVIVSAGFALSLDTSRNHHAAAGEIPNTDDRLPWCRTTLYTFDRLNFPHHEPVTYYDSRSACESKVYVSQRLAFWDTNVAFTGGPCESSR